MMVFLRILLLFLVLCSVSCKKDYVCECSNSNGTYEAGTIERKLKSTAQKDCKDLSTGETTCKLK